MSEQQPSIKTATQVLWDVLTADHSLPLYALADGAANAYIHAHLQAHDRPHLALFTDDGLPAAQSPWLFPLSQQETFSQWYLQESQGQYWGILLAAPLPLAELAEHLKHFLTMQDEQGRLHLMRFYDPRVIKAYLDALTDEQRASFCRPGLQLWADAPGRAETLFHYQQDKTHYSRTLIDLRIDAQACAVGDCAC